MKSCGIVTLVFLVAVYIHAPKVEGSQLFVKRANNDQSNLDVFCAATGGDPLKQKPTCKKTGTSSKEPQLICTKVDSKSTTAPAGATARGELGCSDKAKLEIKFKDCDKSGKKPTKLFCELSAIPISCKKGAAATPVVNPPSVLCVTKGTKPTSSKAQCVPSKEDPTGKFTGTIQCNKKETMTFVGSNSKNPCNDKAGQGILFCTPPTDPNKAVRQ
ncbi:uncharacterized protein MELLADRAFT_59195 [Melampsora larici-populina 98AG31]|uniref:Secreted protein n=1 Tax=Melampsora larici-populina (strain 98AG31 / pathotype 3-4-7) TaxID=747676 RepID=F4R5D9_MELLP|nr:uncharacterized protein MELLADRAFT_59195 [Melampsora larici-populina 98AG31]EGG12278.1 hypothetical protein MELLADRAFT_59195 [Melampsora larici-populina 98AG31]